MANTAFLFSGQGSQYPGMGKELYDQYASVRSIYECGSTVLGFDLAKVSFEGEEAELGRTKISQPAIFAVSMAAYAVVSEFMEPAAFAGHSLGEYAALTAAGTFLLEDGFRVIGARAAAMQKAADAHPGSMFAIVGSDEETVTRVCSETEGYVLPVNFNAPAQTVIAGETEAAQHAADTLASLGAKAVKLAVSSGFHSSLMQDAADELREKIANVKINMPEKPFYCNTSGMLFTPGTNIVDYLCKHLVSGVHFHEEVSAMLTDGISTFVELGPNKVLATLVKRNFKQAASYNVENLKTLEKLKAAL